MFLIIGSSHDDILFYETSLKNAREEVLMNKYHALIGTINNQEVMLLSDVYTSYITTALLTHIIDKYIILLVICVGRCQAFSDNLKVGQVVISRNTIFGDVNQVAAVKGNSLGQIPGFSRFLESNDLLVSTMHKVFERIGLDTVKEATFISGSMLRNSQEFVLNIKNEKATTKRYDEIEKKEIAHLGESIVTDSESGGIALGCSLFGISYITVKVVEGMAGDNVSLDTYLKILKQYSYVGKAILSFIGELSRNDVERMEDQQ
ncbi:MAG: hypothetical protein MJ248_03920 [Bacilli bacterium]|nr:hypothetical protein [Bacilli bacterium]